MTQVEGSRRLCMVVHGPYPVGEPRVAREAAAAVEHGYSVDVVAMRRAHDPAREVIDGVQVTRLPVYHVRGAGIGRVLGEYLAFAAVATGVVGARALRQRYDIVHVHNPPDFLILAALLPRLRGSRVIFDIHDLSPEMFAMRFPRSARWGANLILRAMERFATVFADKVVTVHDPYMRQLVARGTPSDKVTIVMNTLDERLLPAPKSRRMGPLLVAYHGTVTPPYGVHLLVEAAAKSAQQGLDVHVMIVGEGDSVADITARVAALGLSDRVTIRGQYMAHRDVLELVNGASVGVIPNLPTPLSRFALSSKLFEYVALGVPVVSAALPTIQEYFSDDEVLFFEPGSADSLADALLAVARDPQGAEARAERARRRYGRYRWDVSARTYVAMLDRLTSGTESRPIGAPRA
jgi:glycosyltransferase involved in cell wall biosynthesis